MTPTAAEVAATMPGDDLIPRPDVIMDRAFDLAAGPATVWPWFAQLGRRRGGWYLPRRVERLLPSSGRGLRCLDPGLQDIAVGDVIPDWPGRRDTFELVRVEPPYVLVHRAERRAMRVSWAIELRDANDAGAGATRVRMRLRLGPVRRRRLTETVGGLVDLVTIAGLAAGLRERLADDGAT